MQFWEARVAAKVAGGAGIRFYSQRRKQTPTHFQVVVVVVVVIVVVALVVVAVWRRSCRAVFRG